MALRLRWSDERYVRIYCRDTAEWLALSWDAQALYVLLQRKADRAGTIPLGRLGRQAVGALLQRADLWLRLGPALEELERDGCVSVEGDVLRFVGFVEAQEAVSSAAARQRAYRERQAGRHETSPGPSDETSPASNAPSPVSDETSPRHETSPQRYANVTGYSTDGTAPHGTGRHGASDGTTTEPSRPAPPTNGALSASASQVFGYLQKHPAGRQLVDISDDLGVSLNAAEGAARELRTRQLVECVQLGRPPVATWRLAP